MTFQTKYSHYIDDKISETDPTFHPAYYDMYTQVDRTGTKVTVVEQKERKDYNFQQNILELCVECLDRGVVPIQR